jgi:hypothetical protein
MRPTTIDDLRERMARPGVMDGRADAADRRADARKSFLLPTAAGSVT